MAKTPATRLTKKLLTEEGWPAIAVVEIWNPHARIRQDLFGVVDVLAIGPNGTLAVQTTSRSNVSSRLRKISESPNLEHIKSAGWEFEVHGWYKLKNRWTLGRRVDAFEWAESNY